MPSNQLNTIWIRFTNVLLNDGLGLEEQMFLIHNGNSHLKLEHVLYATTPVWRWTIAWVQSGVALVWKSLKE